MNRKLKISKEIASGKLADTVIEEVELLEPPEVEITPYIQKEEIEDGQEDRTNHAGLSVKDSKSANRKFIIESRTVLKRRVAK